MRSDHVLLLTAVVFCGLLGCQESADRTADVAPAGTDRVAVLPSEPDELSPDPSAAEQGVLDEQFPDYTLPLSEDPSTPELSPEPVGRSVPERTIEGQPLATAIYNRNVREARRLIESGHKPDAIFDGYNMLHLAAQRGLAEICGLLIDAGLDIDRKNVQKYSASKTPVQLAVQSGSVATVKLLVKRGAKLTPVDPQRGQKQLGAPLASLAITSGNPEMLRLLIDQGEPADGSELVAMAIRQIKDQTSRQDVLNQLFSAGANVVVGEGLPDPFVAAVRSGDLAILRLLKEKTPVEFGAPHIKAAVEIGDLSMCRYLVSSGARTEPNPPVSAELMRIALVKHRSPELVELIAEAGEEKKYCVQSKACTSYCALWDFAHPLYHAVMQDDLDFCRYLIREFSSDENLWSANEYEPYEYERDVEFFQQGNTVLFAAVYEDNAEALKLLLKYGVQPEPGESPKVDIDARNWSGSTVLHEAVNFGAARCVQLLLAAGADPTIARNDGCTPLHLAARHHLIPHHSGKVRMEAAISRLFPMLVASTLARSDADWIHALNQKGETVLHRHAWASYPEVCLKLIELGSDVNMKDMHGLTALNHAFVGSNVYLSKTERQNCVDTCLVLLDNGTSLDQADLPEYHNYLCQAAASNLYEVFDALLDRGFDKDLDQNAGYLLCSAAKFGNQERVRQLLQWGADIGAAGKGNSTALHQAARTKDLEMCKLLVANGADVNARDDRGQTPLFEVFDRWATHMQKFLTGTPDVTQAKALAVLKLLIAHGADPAAAAESTTSTSHSGTVLDIFKNMPAELRDVLAKAKTK